jgi:hypothetical protein
LSEQEFKDDSKQAEWTTLRISRLLGGCTYMTSLLNVEDPPAFDFNVK